MTQIKVATRFREEDAKIDAATMRKARRTVAAYANDADDCRLLFDILGIRPSVAEEPSQPEPEPAEPTNRPAGEEHVPVAHLIAVVERLKSAKGWGRREIAKRAGVNASTLTGVCAPSHPHEFVRKGMYIAVLRLAEENGV